MKLVFAYEFAHIESITPYAADPEATIIAIDFWVERALAKRGIPFTSFSRFILDDSARQRWLEATQDIAREWYRLPEMTFFTHRGIRLAEAAEPAVGIYLERFLYHFIPLQKVFAEYTNITEVIVPHSSAVVQASSGPFTKFEITTVFDIVCALAKEHGYMLNKLGTPPSGEVLPFPPHMRSSIMFSIWNFCIRFLVPSRSIKIFASETWAHIAPFLSQMDNAELILMDRSEVRNIPWREIIRHRIRFMHPTALRSSALRRIRSEAQQNYRKCWKKARTAVGNMPYFTRDGTSWWPLIADAFDFFMEVYAERLIHDTEALALIYKKETVGKVLLRASVSAKQHHFFLAAKVASSLDIPSIELQHAGSVVDMANPQSRLEASYLAAYGSLTSNLISTHHGYAPERMRAIGSPRFDRYLTRPPLTETERREALSSVGLDSARPTILIAVPPEIIELVAHVFDSYEQVRIYAALAYLQKAIPEVQIVFKFRGTSCTPLHRDYIAEVFGTGTYAIVSDDLFYRMQMSDIIFSSDSTAFYEAMIARKPLVLYPWKKTDAANIAVYEQAAPVVFEPAELIAETKRILVDILYQDELINRSSTFLHEYYAFDGHSSERMAVLLRESLTVY